MQLPMTPCSDGRNQTCPTRWLAPTPESEPGSTTDAIVRTTAGDTHAANAGTLVLAAYHRVTSAYPTTTKHVAGFQERLAELTTTREPTQWPKNSA